MIFHLQVCFIYIARTVASGALCCTKEAYDHVTPYEKALWRQEVTSSGTRLRGGHQPRPVWVRGGRRDILNVRRAKVKTRRVTLTIVKSANGELRPHHSHNKNDPSIHPLAVSGSRPDFHTLRDVQRRDPIWSIHSSQTSCLETTHQLRNPRWQQWGFDTPRLSPCHLLLIKANSWLWLNGSR